VISAYMYVNRGNDYDFPYKEAIQSIEPICDEIIVGSDPRFDDGTIETLSDLQKDIPQLQMMVEECDHSVPCIHATIKNKLRALCQGDWLIEMDADKIFPVGKENALKSALDEIPPDVMMVGVGLIPYFNGNLVKISEPMIQPMISRNVPGLQHGGIARREAEYISTFGTVIDVEYALAKRIQVDVKAQSTKRDFKRIVDQIQKGHKDPRQIWFHHYSWFCLPRKWEETWQTLHYYEGRMSGKYQSLEEYTHNLDGVRVSFWGEHDRRGLSYYQPAILSEMENRYVHPFKVEHPALMTDWIDRQRSRILEHSPSKKDRGRWSQWTFKILGKSTGISQLRWSRKHDR